MSIGFWFDSDKIDETAKRELEEEHFRRLVDKRKAYLEGKKPWWRRLLPPYDVL